MWRTFLATSLSEVRLERAIIALHTLNMHALGTLGALHIRGTCPTGVLHGDPPTRAGTQWHQGDVADYCWFLFCTHIYISTIVVIGLLFTTLPIGMKVGMQFIFHMRIFVAVVNYPVMFVSRGVQW